MPDRKNIYRISDSIQSIKIDNSRKKSLQNLKDLAADANKSLESLEEQAYLYGFISEGIAMFEAIKAVDDLIDSLEKMK